MRRRYRIFLLRAVIVVLLAVLTALITVKRNNGFAIPGDGNNIRTSGVVKEGNDGNGTNGANDGNGTNDVNGTNGGSDWNESGSADADSMPDSGPDAGDMDGKNENGHAAGLMLRDYERLSIDPLSPQIYEGAALKKRMEELAELDETYRKIYKNYEDYPENILAAYCNEPGMAEFVLGYTVMDGQEEPEYTKEELEAEFPLLLQWDKRWGYEDYGDSCIGLAGCAPVCMAMVALAVTGDADVTPDRTAECAMERGYYLKGTGTTWSFMTEGAKYFGLYGRELGVSESSVISELEAGHPVICSMRPGTFTVRGHFIVLAGLQDGRIIVRDPNSPYRSSLLWDFRDIKGQIKNMWSYTKLSQDHNIYFENHEVQYEIITS